MATNKIVGVTDPAGVNGVPNASIAGVNGTTFTQAGGGGGINGLDEITNMTSWWDASDESSITHSSDLVSQIDDLITTNHFTTAGGARPTTNSASDDQNGLNTLVFSGNFMTLSSITSSADQYWCMVLDIDGSSVDAFNDAPIAFVSTSSPLVDYKITAGSTTQWDGYFDGRGFSVDSALSGSAYDGLYILECLMDRSAETVDFYIDGSSVLSTTGYDADVSFELIRLMCDDSTNNRLGGRFMELGWMNGNLPTAQNRTDILAYTATKWGGTW